MTQHAFSMKDALKHGMAVTRKHLGLVLGLAVIYFFYSFVSGFINGMAGKGSMRLHEVQQFYGGDGEAANFLYGHLKQEGYIDEFGDVQPKLDALTSPEALILPLQLEEERGAIFQFLQEYRYRLPFPRLLYYGLAVILWLIDILLQIGLLKIAIMLSRGEAVSVAELVGYPHLLLKYFLAGLCFGLAVVGGLILLVVPGIIMAVMLGMYAYFIVDHGFGPIAALKASRELTRGSRMRLFLFGGLTLLFNLAGLLCFGVGLLFTVPSTSIAYAYVYDRLLAAKVQEGPAA